MKSFSVLASKGRVIKANFDSLTLIGEVNTAKCRSCKKASGDEIKEEKEREGEEDRAVVSRDLANKWRGMEAGGGKHVGVGEKTRE